MDRIAFLKKTYGKKIQKAKTADTFAATLSDEDILTRFKEADPTDGKFIQWIVLRYVAQDFRVEDMPRVSKALENFLEKRNGLENKDINCYRSLNDLEDEVDDCPVVTSKRQEKQKVKAEGSEVIAEDDSGKIIHIKTQEAATYYGKGTKWCTSGENGNMFNDYNERGPLFLVLAEDGRKFQFHLDDDQFMDERDSSVTPKWLAENYPVFDTFFASYAQHLLDQANAEDDQKKSRELTEKAACAAVMYCEKVVEGRSEKMEKFIVNFAHAAKYYAEAVLKEPWDEVEKSCMADDWHGPCAALVYARDVLKGKLRLAHDDFVNLTGFASKEWAKDFSDIYRRDILGESIEEVA